MSEYMNIIEEIKRIIKDPLNRKIINQLKENNPIYLGDVIRKLKIDPQTGTMRIYEMKQVGLIDYVEKTALMELNTRQYKYAKKLIGEE